MELTAIRNGIIFALMLDPQDPQSAICELIDSFGYSEARIAEEIRGLDDGLTTSQSSIHRIKNGKQTPRFDEGVAILKLRERVKAQVLVADSATTVAG